MIRINKHIVLLTLSACLTFGLQAQYSNTTSQYMFNGLVLNPAYAGVGDVTTLNLNYRNQWTGFSGAPLTQQLSAHAPLKKSPISIGGILRHDKIGVNSDFNLMGIASYKIDYRKSQLNFGIGAGVGYTQSLWSQVITEQEGDQLFQGDQTSIRPIYSFGAYYENREWYLGYSAPSLLSYSHTNSNELEPFFSFGLMEHNLTAGIARSIGRDVVLKPSVLVKVIPSASYQLDVNANFIFQDRFWAGLSLRMDRSVIVLLEYQINHQFRLGYAYDHGFNSLSRYALGSHELMVIWQKKNKSLARSPRYF